VCDLQFKAKAFFDTAIVSSYMKPIWCKWFPLCMTSRRVQSYQFYNYYHISGRSKEPGTWIRGV
jgi:hypothetical protein